jgi:hypothetical protein
MFKLTLIATCLASLMLAGCPENERVRVVEERRPVVIVHDRNGGEHREEERR